MIDIAIFDPQAVKAREPEWAEDYPGATRRLVQRSEGMHAVIVNGRFIYRDGKLTGDLPGQVLRGAANQVFVT
jgi:N-acyl-D-amino-acid deacylase